MWDRAWYKVFHMTRLDIYTDGGCHGNPGPGGWAFVVVGTSVVTERYGAAAQTTNNRMELTAVIAALEHCRAEVGVGAELNVHTDSQYVRNGITDWIQRWRRNGWRTAARKSVKNRELWQQLDYLNEQLRPQWTWVRGHDGDHYNERCHTLVQQAIATRSLKQV